MANLLYIYIYIYIIIEYGRRRQLNNLTYIKQSFTLSGNPSSSDIPKYITAVITKRHLYEGCNVYDEIQCSDMDKVIW